MRRLLLPIALAVGAFTMLLAARASDRSIGLSTAASPAESPATPVLSARRVPELLQSPVVDGQLASALDKRVMAISPPDTCVIVRQGQRTLFAKNDKRAVVPASNLKLLTAVAALDVLGPDTRLRTSLAAEAPAGNGAINGNLYVIGGGDPVIATKDYADRYGYPVAYTDLAVFAERLAAIGVSEIRGDIVADDRRFDQQRSVPSWPSRLIAQGQVGPIGALVVNDGFVTYGRDPDITNQNSPSPDPAGHFATLLRTELRNRGIRVNGGARAGNAPDRPVEVAFVDSPTVREIVGEMLTVSDNNTAEALTKEIGRKTKNEATTAAGIVGIRAAVTARRLPVDGVAIVDGSGLDPAGNKVTCAIIADILTNEPTGSVVLSALPLAGKTGTLHDRYEQPPLAGNLRAKTGRLQNASALSGWLTTTSQRTITFAYIANVAPDRSLGEVGITAQNALAEILVSYATSPTLDELAPQALVRSK